MLSSDTHPALSERTRVKLPIAAWVMFTGSLAFSIGGAIGSFLIAQHQIATHERRIERLEESNANNRLLLERIDERTAEIKRRLDTK